MKGTVLITGAAGFMGRHFVRALKKDFNVVGIDLNEPARDKEGASFYQIDVQDYPAMEKLVNAFKPEVIVHTAAQKSLLKCEAEPEVSKELNYGATLNLLDLAKAHHSHFVFISSDIVFDGKMGNYAEDATVNPINNYGLFKAEAEKHVLAYEKGSVCRTALVFGALEPQDQAAFEGIKNHPQLLNQSYFVDYIKNRLAAKQETAMPVDEWMNPTSAAQLSAQIKAVIQKKRYGLFHTCGGEQVSRYQFAKKVAQFYQLDDSFLKETTGTDKIRPLNVTLNYEKSEKALGIKYQSMDEMLAAL